MSEAGVNEESRLVELRAIRKAFGENVVLDGIDLSIGRGEVIVIAGPSGSGKSTMLRCINGLETVDEGEVRFDGRPVSGAGKALAQLRSEIGMVFQQFNLFAHKTVMQNVTLAPMEVKGLSKADARDRGQKLLERVGISEKADAYPGGPLGRPAAAGGDRPRARDGAQAHALRRADLGARPGDDPGGARRHARPRARRHDDGRRDARDGVRARGVRPHRVHRRRPRSSRRARRRSSSRRPRASGRATSSTRSSTTREREQRMRTTRWLAVLALVLGARRSRGCGDDEDSSGGGGGGESTPAAEVEKFDAGTTLGDIQEKGEIVIGVKYDVPPFGFKNPSLGQGRGLRRRPRPGGRRQARREAEVHRGDLRQPDPVPGGRHRRPDPLDDDDQRGARRADRVLRPVLHRQGPDPRQGGQLRDHRRRHARPARTSARRSARPTRRRSRSRRPTAKLKLVDSYSECLELAAERQRRRHLDR